MYFNFVLLTSEIFRAFVDVMFIKTTTLQLRSRFSLASSETETSKYYYTLDRIFRSRRDVPLT